MSWPCYFGNRVITRHVITRLDCTLICTHASLIYNFFKYTIVAIAKSIKEVSGYVLGYKQERYRSEKVWVQIREHNILWVQIRESLGTDQRKRGYRSENVISCGYRSEKAWVQIRESVGTDQRM